MTRQTLADHRAGQHVQRGEQGRRPVALVVVGHRPRPPGLDRQRRLSAIERLDLGLLVHAEDHRLLGRVEVEPHNVNELRLELRVGGELEGLDAVRLDPTSRPHSLHRRGGHRRPLGHRATRPVRLPRRRLTQREPDDLLDLRGRDRRAPAPTRPDRREVLEPILRKPLPPRPHRHRRDPDLRGDPRVRKPIASHQQHPGALHIPVRRGLRTDQLLEHRSLLSGDR